MERSIGRTPLLAATLALALVTGTLVAMSTSAADAAIPYPDTTRIPASNAIQAGINVSKAIYANGSATSVVLTRNDKFPDGLSAAGIAGEFDAPVLFTGPSSLDPATETELRRVLPTGRTVFLMGGEAALSQSIANRLSGDYKVERIAGTDRIDTAAIAAIRWTRSGPDGTAILVRAYGSPGQDNTEGWVDAISCGGFAAERGTPILLTNNQAGEVHPRTLDALTQIQARRVIICGGTAAVPKEHADQLIARGYAVDRYSGSTRIGTATDVARRLWGYDSTIDRDFILVNGWGDNFAYGIAAAPLSGKTNAPIVLGNSNSPTTQPTDCPVPADAQQETLCYLMRRSNDRIASLTVVGSESLIGDPVFAAAAKAGGLPEDTAAPSVPSEVKATNTPQDDGKGIDVTWKASTDDTGGDITYTVYFRESTSGDMTAANSTKGGEVKNATSLTVRVPAKDKTYQVGVTARDQFGNTSALGGPASATPTDEAPAAPQHAPNPSNVPGGVQLNWLEAPEADAEGYIVERAQPVSSAPQINPPTCSGDQLTSPTWKQLGEAVKPKTNTRFVDTTAEAGKEYCYRYKVFDTTGNTTAPSPVARFQAETSTGDTTPPSAAPTFYAVGYDQQRGSILGGNSRVNTSAPRADVIVAAGTFQAGETTGRLQILNGSNGSKLVERSFTVTGSEQVVSVDVPIPVGTTTLVARLADPDGNLSAESQSWIVERDTAFRPTPRITIVEDVVTDPAKHANARVPVVGDPTPLIDATPKIVIEGIEPASHVILYNNNTERWSANSCENPRSPSKFTVNDKESDADLVVQPGTSNFVVVQTPCSPPFNGRQTANRSGDSNTVTYVYDDSVFGVELRSPGPDEVVNDLIDNVEVRFNGPATTSSTVKVFDLGNNEVGSATNDSTGDAAGSDARTIRIATFAGSAEKLPPGVYRVVVNASGTDRSGTVDDLTYTVRSGFVHHVHIDAVQAADGSRRNSTSMVTLVASPGAPAGQYRAYLGTSPSPFGVLNVQPGDTDGERQNVAVSGYEGLAVSWDFQPAEASGPLAKQPDGEIPARLSGKPCTTASNPPADSSSCETGGHGPGTGQLDKLAIRTVGGSDFILAQSTTGVVDARYEILYWPSISSLPSDVFAIPAPVVARDNTGTFRRFGNETVNVGWKVDYVLRDIEGGHLGLAANDGAFYGVDTITPANGLGNAAVPPRLQANDTLQVDFVVNVQTGTGGPQAGTDGGLKIFDGPSGSRKAINPNFGAAGGALWELARPLDDSILIRFGTASTYNGTALGTTGAAVTGPTALHGGPVKSAVNWLLSTEFDNTNSNADLERTGGHVFILPVSDSPKENPGTF